VSTPCRLEALYGAANAAALERKKPVVLAYKLQGAEWCVSAVPALQRQMIANFH